MLISVNASQRNRRKILSTIEKSFDGRLTSFIFNIIRDGRALPETMKPFHIDNKSFKVIYDKLYSNTADGIMLGEVTLHQTIDGIFANISGRQQFIKLCNAGECSSLIEQLKLFFKSSYDKK